MKLLVAKDNLRSEGTMRLAAMVDGDSDAVGCIDLYNYDPVHHRAEVGIVVRNDCRRQGAATEMLHQLTLFCQTQLRLHQLYCDIVSTNTASQQLFLNCGYRPCAQLREWCLVDDEYVDVVRMQLLL